MNPNYSIFTSIVFHWVVVAIVPAWNGVDSQLKRELLSHVSASILNGLSHQVLLSAFMFYIILYYIILYYIYIFYIYCLPYFLNTLIIQFGKRLCHRICSFMHLCIVGAIMLVQFSMRVAQWLVLRIDLFESQHWLLPFVYFTNSSYKL